MEESALWKRAYEIFDSVLELPVEEREQAAREQAGSDPGLLKIVLDLLANSAEGLDEAAVSGVLPAGHRIGRYEIIRAVGRGGMGRVYAARDTELGRVVALKVVSAANTSDRLIREAKAASALNHPNIVSVHEVVRQGTDVAIAMELVDGQPLRVFCSEAQPVDRVTAWGRQIAHALSATHKMGIIHRDIKPENVMLRTDGYIKVLDFGLARRDRLPGASSHSSLFANLGGTLNYMSPEQTRGETLQPPSDIFSLGIVLYELATGSHPFPGGSPIATAYAIAHHRPKHLSTLPSVWRDLLGAMMAPKPEDRPSAAEVEHQLASLAGDQLKPDGKRRLASIGVAAALLAGLATGVWFWQTPHSSSGAVMRYSIPLERVQPVRAVAVSPRGDQIAYQDSDRLYRMDRMGPGKFGPPQAIPGSEEADAPFFSPDGHEVGYFSKNRLRAASTAGFRDLGPLPLFAQLHGVWAKNGFIYFNGATGGTSGIWRISDRGGKPETVIGAESSARGIGFRMIQQSLTDGLLFSVNFGPMNRAVDWLDGSTGETERIVERGMGGQITSSGHLIYYWMGRLLAAPLDTSRHRLAGPAVEVVNGVEGDGWVGAAAGISETGTLAWVKRREPALRRLVWLTQDGHETPLPLAPDAFEQFDVAPDGSRIAIVRTTAQRRWVLSLYDVKTNASSTLIETPFEKLRAIWSPDSKSLVVSLGAEGREFANLFRVPVDAPDRAERLTDQSDFGQYPMSWSGPAGAILFVEGIHTGAETNIMMLSLLTGRTKELVASKGADRSASFSPDGKWFVYSMDSERAVFLQDVAQTQPPRKIPGSDGGWNPVWSPQGNRIYYLNPSDGLMEVPVRADGATGAPHQLMKQAFTAHNTDFWARNYAIARDGRFLVMRDVPPAVPVRQEIQVIENWFSELNRLAPRP